MISFNVTGRSRDDRERTAAIYFNAFQFYCTVFNSLLLRSSFVSVYCPDSWSLMVIGGHSILSFFRELLTRLWHFPAVYINNNFTSGELRFLRFQKPQLIGTKTPYSMAEFMFRLETRKPSWRKGKRATAVREWRPLAKKSTANFQLMFNSNRGRITYGLRIAIFSGVEVENRHLRL